MKVNGLMSRKKVMEQRYFQTDAFTKGSILTEKQQAQALMFGPMVNAMMVSGLTDLSMGLECGEARREIVIKGSGSSANPKDMVFIHGLMVITMKANSKNA